MVKWKTNKLKSKKQKNKKWSVAPLGFRITRFTVWVCFLQISRVLGSQVSSKGILPTSSNHWLCHLHNQVWVVWLGQMQENKVTIIIETSRNFLGCSPPLTAFPSVRPNKTSAAMRRTTRSDHFQVVVAIPRFLTLIKTKRAAVGAIRRSKVV